MPKPINHELDAACALLLDDEQMSVREAGGLLGIAHSNVAARAKRYKSVHIPPVARREMDLWARGFVAGRRSALDERVQAAPESWEDRLARLTPDSAAGWQTVHVMPYDSATSSVSKLRLSRHAIERGGSWQFRVERVDDVEVMEQGDHAFRRVARIMAKWRGTPCTNCGAVTEDERTCSLCGCDKTTPDGDEA